MANYRIVEVEKNIFSIQKLTSRPKPPNITDWDSGPVWINCGRYIFSLRQARKRLAKIKHNEITYPRVVYEEEI